MTQRAGTIAKQPDFCRDERDRGRLALGADHGGTSGDPKRAELQKQSEGVIQCNGIANQFSTGRELISDESNNYIYIEKMSFDDANTLFWGPKVAVNEADGRFGWSNSKRKEKRGGRSRRAVKRLILR
jgi:hypothetical protein